MPGYPTPPPLQPQFAAPAPAAGAGQATSAAATHKGGGIFGHLSDFFGTITGAKYADRVRSERYEHMGNLAMMQAWARGEIGDRDGRYYANEEFKLLHDKNHKQAFLQSPAGKLLTQQPPQGTPPGQGGSAGTNVPMAPPQIPGTGGAPASPGNFSPMSPQQRQQLAPPAPLPPPPGAAQGQGSGMTPTSPPSAGFGGPAFAMQSTLPDVPHIPGGPFIERTPWDSYQAGVRQGAQAEGQLPAQLRINQQTAQAQAEMNARILAGQRQATEDFLARPENQAFVKSLTPAQLASYKEQLTTGKDINLRNPVRFSIPGTGMSVAGETDFNGNPVAPGTPGRREWLEGRGTIFTPEPERTRRLIVKDANSPTGWSAENVGVITGKQVGEREPGVAVPSTDLTRQFNTFEQQTDAQGNISFVPVTKFSGPMGGSLSPPPAATGTGAAGTLGAATGGAATPAPAKNGMPSARISGPAIPSGGVKNPLTRQERETLETKGNALDETLAIAKRVQSNLPLLHSMLTSAKIDLQADPQQNWFKMAANRLMPLSDNEARLAADFGNLTDRINLLRTPLGAGGFRSHDAWMALQALRGNPRANPKVTADVLGDTVKTLNSQLNVVGRALSGKTTPQPWMLGLPEPPAAAATQYKKGDTVMYQGRPHVVTDVVNGKLVLAP